MTEVSKPMVHAFSFNGELFLLDVNSGSLLRVDEPTFAFVSELGKGFSPEEVECKLRESFPGISEVRAEVEQLKSEGVLFSPPEYFYKSTLSLKSMCLNVAHSCNFACKYCFAKKGSYGGRQSVMQAPVAKKAIDFLVSSAPGRESLEVDFFGGEPLLALDTVRKTIEYAKTHYPERTWRFTLTTNGSLIDGEIEAFLYDNDVSLVLSLDGGKETNDVFRVFPNGMGTYDYVIKNLKFVAEHRKDSQGYYIRGTYTHATLFLSKMAKDLFEMGFNFISLEPVVTKEQGIGIQEKDLPLLRAEYEKLARFFVETQSQRRWQFFHFNVDLSQGPCIQKRINGCGAGVEYVAVSPDGSIYPCHQFDGIEGFKLGNVDEGFTRTELVKLFDKANYLFCKKECSECWARFYCGGGCLANNYNMCGDLFKPYPIGCELQKARIEAALYVQYKLMDNDY